MLDESVDILRIASEFVKRRFQRHSTSRESQKCIGELRPRSTSFPGHRKFPEEWVVENPPGGSEGGDKALVALRADVMIDASFWSRVKVESNAKGGVTL